MSPDWQQPFIFIFEWGMFVLGWTIVFVLGVIAIAVIYAFIKTMIEVAKKKNAKIEKKPSHPGGSFDDNPPRI